MALVQRNFSKLNAFAARLSAVRCFSASQPDEKNIKKSVFISQSKDIFTNLALEDWMYKNMDFTNHHVLMLWQNDPCVVVGRNQNPWLEANVPELGNITENGVQLARRNSGGGTVYHDNGNLNLTFFTPREHYNRKYNLEIITRALFREYNAKIDINKREDLTVRDYKVSGTAAKLGRLASYHHCTLLVNVNKVDLSQALFREEVGIKTKATQSLRSKVMNLVEENRQINVKDLLKAVGWEYMRTKALTVKDGGMELANQQKGFQMINPTEKWFPGITELRDNLSSWEWCFGKTPKFSITRSFSIPETLLNSSLQPNEDFKVTLHVEKGYIGDITLYVPPGVSIHVSGEVQALTSLKGQKFSQEALKSLENSLEQMVDGKERFVTECVKRLVASV